MELIFRWFSPTRPRSLRWCQIFFSSMLQNELKIHSIDFRTLRNWETYRVKQQLIYRTPCETRNSDQSEKSPFKFSIQFRFPFLQQHSSKVSSRTSYRRNLVTIVSRQFNRLSPSADPLNRWRSYRLFQITKLRNRTRYARLYGYVIPRVESNIV